MSSRRNGTLTTQQNPQKQMIMELFMKLISSARLNIFSTSPVNLGKRNEVD